MKDNFQFSIFNFQLFYRFLLWRDKHIKEKHFILIVSFLVGICTAAAAIVLKSIIHFIQHLLTGNFNQDGANYLYLLYPVIGILLAGLFVKYIVRDDISHGVTKILYAISQRKSRIKPHNAWTSIVASSVTIGFGGSVGGRGTHCVDRGCDRIQLGPPVPHGAKDFDVAGRLWGCRGDCRYIQSSDCWGGVCGGSAVVGPDDDVGTSFAYHFGDGCDCFLYFYGYGSNVSVFPDRSVCDRAYSLCAVTRCFLWFGALYFTKVMNRVEGCTGT